MNAFTIKDIENLSGIKAHTIRIWEQRYSFLKPQRTGTNIRYYNNEQLKSILNIALLNKYGYKISHIDKMHQEEITQKLFHLTNHTARQERIVHELIGYMIDLRLESFEELLNTQIEATGIENTIDHIIFPFLDKVGILWLTSNINPAHEHLVTNFIRQKILVGIENAIAPHLNITAVLFLPEGEHHELSLIYVHYLMRRAGIKVLYLGADVPIVDLEYVFKTKKPHLLYTHVTANSHRFNCEKFMNNLHAKVGDVTVYLSGPLAVACPGPYPVGFHVKQSLAEVKELIAGLV